MTSWPSAAGRTNLYYDLVGNRTKAYLKSDTATTYLHDWCQLSRAIDIATGYFEISSFLALGDEWRKVDRLGLTVSW